MELRVTAKNGRYAVVRAVNVQLDAVSILALPDGRALQICEWSFTVQIGCDQNSA